MEKLSGLLVAFLALITKVASHDPESESLFSVSEALGVSSFSYFVILLTLTVALTSLYFIATTLLNEIEVVES